MKKVVLLVLLVSLGSVTGCANKIINEPEPCACGELKDVNKHYLQSIS